MTEFRKPDRPTAPLPVPTDWVEKTQRPQRKAETTGTLPLDISRLFDGSSADIFIADDPSPRIGEDSYASSTRPLLSKGMQAASSPEARSPQDRRDSPAMKTLELSHLSHLQQMPMEKVSGPGQSVLFQMKGEGDQNQAALYAQMAARIAFDEKKKKRKKRLIDFIKSIFESY